MFNNILVTGAKGQLGSELRMLLENTSRKVFFTDIEELDITDVDAVCSYVSGKNIDLIINCAAYTAVDKAEEEPELADKINHLAVKNLATIASEQNMRLVHISTDYVFPGTSCRPYKEDDKPDSIGVYGKTKLLGENAITERNLNSIIIRTCWLYSSFGSKTFANKKKEHNYSILYE